MPTPALQWACPTSPSSASPPRWASACLLYTSIQAEYVIAYLDDAYQTTIIGRSKRDYVWIMACVPCLSDDAYAQLAGRVAALGYTEPLRKVPQRCQ